MWICAVLCYTLPATVTIFKFETIQNVRFRSAVVPLGKKNLGPSRLGNQHLTVYAQKVRIYRLIFDNLSTL